MSYVPVAQFSEMIAELTTFTNNFGQKLVMLAPNVAKGFQKVGQVHTAVVVVLGTGLLCMKMKICVNMTS